MVKRLESQLERLPQEHNLGEEVVDLELSKGVYKMPKPVKYGFMEGLGRNNFVRSALLAASLLLPAYGCVAGLQNGVTSRPDNMRITLDDINPNDYIVYQGNDFVVLDPVADGYSPNLDGKLTQITDPELKKQAIYDTFISMSSSSKEFAGIKVNGELVGLIAGRVKVDVKNNGTIKVEYDPGSSTGGDGGSSGGSSSSGGTCFVAGTKITMSDGTLKNIEDVKAGEEVLTFNEEKGENESQKVLETKSHLSNHYYDVKFEDGTVLKVTENHPLLSRNGWSAINVEAALNDKGVECRDLVVGDEILSSNGNYRKIVSMDRQDGEIVVYDLSKVAVTHTFFVEGLVAHNKGSGGRQ